MSIVTDFFVLWLILDGLWQWGVIAIPTKVVTGFVSGIAQEKAIPTKVEPGFVSGIATNGNFNLFNHLNH